MVDLDFSRCEENEIYSEDLNQYKDQLLQALDALAI